MPVSHEEPPSVDGVTDDRRFPTRPIDRWARPFVQFLHIESASGVVLLLCTLVALVVANSPWADAWNHFWETRVFVGIGSLSLDKSLLHFINDGLMTIFFFVVGLEIKRELVTGELRDPRKAALPIMAAMGGMIVPATVYFLMQRGQPGEPGWGIPMATDIAFVVGFLALLGPRVPVGLKIMLLTLAIADDIGAVLVIAVFYSTDLSPLLLIVAASGFVLIALLNRLGVRRVAIYLVVGAGIWLAVLKSGVHPTVAGVMLGLLTPASAWIGQQRLRDSLNLMHRQILNDVDGEWESHQRPVLRDMEWMSREAISPLERLEIGLHPWVAFLIMPLFALANAGVTIDAASFQHPVTLSVALGLFLGKPIGVVLFSVFAVALGLGKLPGGVSWTAIVGAGFLAGIGFTMSLFVAGLALEGDLLAAGKLGTLLGSALSAVVGLILLVRALPARDKTN